MQIFYKINHWLHMAIGTIIVGFTLTMSLLAFKYYEYKVREGLHSQLGYAVLILSGIILVSGFVTYIVKIKLRWQSLIRRQIKLYHKFLGYALIIMS